MKARTHAHKHAHPQSSSGKYTHLLGIVLVKVLESVLARIEKKMHVFAHIITTQIPNTNVIHANACWCVFTRIIIHANTFTMYLACIVVCIESVFARILNQYVRNTNTIHTNTEWYVLNTYLLVLFARILNQYVRNTNTIQTNTEWYVLNTYLLVLNTCWYVFNIYHQYIPLYLPQYMPIHRESIGMY